MQLPRRLEKFFRVLQRMPPSFRLIDIERKRGDRHEKISCRCALRLHACIAERLRRDGAARHAARAADTRADLARDGRAGARRAREILILSEFAKVRLSFFLGLWYDGHRKVEIFQQLCRRIL